MTYQISGRRKKNRTPSNDHFINPSGSSAQLSSCRLTRPLLLLVLRPTLFGWVRRIAGVEALIEIVDDVVKVFKADGDPDHVFRDAGVDLFLVGKLFVRGGPRMDGQGLGVSDTVKRGCHEFGRDVLLRPDQSRDGEDRGLTWRGC